MATPGLASESFQRSLDRFRDKLSDEQKKDFQMASIDQVKKTIEQIQDKIGPEKKLRIFARLNAFLEGMKQVEELVTVFLNVHEVVAFVWGPIKLGLMMASAHIRTLEMLMDAYKDIGTFLEGIGQLERLFQNYSGARRILEDCFDDILRFHQVAIDEFSRPGWKKLADCLWPQIKKRFGPILKSLKNRNAALAEGKLGAAIEEIQTSRDITAQQFRAFDALIKAQFDETKEFQQRQHSELLGILERERGSIFAKLDPPDYQEDHYAASKQRHVEDSGSWILEDPKFKQWIGATTRRDAVLYLSGMPGSGKTTLVSKVVDYLKSNRDVVGGNVTFFYFKHHRVVGSSERPLASMLRAILTQLLNQDDAILGYLHQRCDPLSKSDIIQEPFLKELARDSIALQQRCWIILDGLDECDEPDAHQDGAMKSIQIIQWVLGLLLPANVAGNASIRVLFSGQKNGHIDQTLSSYPSIHLDATDRHILEVQRYSEAMATTIGKRFSLDGPQEANIATRVSTTAKAMFLYAKLVLENLLSQDSLAELKDELSQEHFPEGLDAAYERLVVRVLDRPPPPRRKTASTILGWLVCSPRQLRWREIQSKFCIDPEKGVCNFDNRRLDNCKVICGSLVELSPCELFRDLVTEDRISLVHETARSYLFKRLPLSRAHADMAIFCTQYLTSAAFSHSRTADEIRDAALSGYYGAIDYAAACWKIHARKVCCAAIPNDGLGEETRNTVLQSAQGILEAEARSRRPLQLGFQHDSEQATMSEQFPEHSEAPTLPDFLADDEKSVFVAERVTAIRHIIELIKLPSSSAFTELNGTGRFKCPRVECCKFSDGFLLHQERQDHVVEHERPFKCSVDGCYSSTVGYSSQEALNAHFKRLHSSESMMEDLFPRSREATHHSIFDAAAKGDLERVKSLHASGIPLDRRHKLGGWLTPLTVASRNGHAKVCQYLIQQGENPFSADRYQIRGSALVEAIRRKDHELIRLMRLTTRSKPTIEEIGSAIAYAVCYGMALECERLLADATANECDPEQLLYEILQNSCVIPPDMVSRNAGLAGIQKSLTESIFRFTFPALYSPTSHFPSSEGCNHHGAEAKKQRHRLRTLINRTVNASSYLSLLDLVVEKCLYYIIQVLLDFFEKTNMLDVDMGHRILHQMLGSVKVRHARDQPPTQRVTARSSTILRILEGTGGAPANMKDPHGRLLLHRVCEFGYEDAIPPLIQYTTNLDEEDDSGKTPLEVAMARGFYMGVSLLVGSGRVNLARKTRYGETMHIKAQQLVRKSVLSRGDYEKIAQLLKPQEESSTEGKTTGPE